MDNNNKPLNVRLRGDQKKNSTSSIKKVNKKENSSGNKNTKENNPKNKSGKNKKIGWKIFRVVLIVGLAMCIVGAGIVLGVISGIVDDTDSISLDELEILPQTSFAYDMNGNELAALYDTENRIMASFEDMPKHTVDAVVAIEDERFFSHHGVDLKRTIGAIGTFVLHKGESSYGASTITQQLVKNITDDDERAWQRKIREWYRAISLESKLSKEKIFESYVNTIYYGDGSYGIEVASNHFFGKSVSELNVAESAAIAAMIQSPEVTNPYKSDEAKEKLNRRKEIVLNKMKELGSITQEQYDEAIAYKLEFKSKEVNYGGTQTYFIDAVVESVIEDLMDQKNVSRGIAMKMIHSDGYKIYTTQDPKVQSAIDDAFANSGIFYTDWDGDRMQGSMVVMDQTNGEVRGLIGGAGEKEGSLTLNRATQTLRQLGSCSKPFGAYGPAIEQGKLSPGAGLDDTQLSIGNYTPKNWYFSFYGFVTVRQAILYSMNIPALRANLLVNDQDYAYNFAYNCGLKSLIEADKGPSQLALGGYNYGVTTLEVADAYATLANGGMHNEPKLYTKVLDRNGNIVLDNTKIEANRVMKDSTAYMLTSCLVSVTTEYDNMLGIAGTGVGAVKINGGAIECAGKTGNTNGDKDRWFCGYTPYYTIACWTGYDDPKDLAGRGRGYPYPSTVLFNLVMNAICADKPGAGFEAPSSVRKVELCRDSGKVATDACRADPRGSRVLSDWVAIDSIPTDTCTVHEFVNICNVTGKVASSSCKSTTKKSCLVRNYGPSQGAYPADWGYTKPTEVCNGKHAGSGSGNVIVYKNGVAQ